MASIFTKDQIRKAEFRTAKGMVRSNLMNSDEWLVRGMIALFHRQTLDEKSDQTTKHKNHRGFNSADSPLLTSFSVQFIERQRRDYRGEWLSGKQIFRARQMMLKYAGQLTRIARGEDQPSQD